MNAVVRALFDDAAITGAQAAGLKDTSTAAMRAAVREWFELFFMREAVKGKDEDPAPAHPLHHHQQTDKGLFCGVRFQLYGKRNRKNGVAGRTAQPH